MRTIAIFLLAVDLFAHTVPAEEVIAYLNSASVKEQAGVVRADRLPELRSVLVIEVGAKWFELREDDRRKLARQWQAMWRHAIRKGRLSIVDSESGEPVVRFVPRGHIEVKARDR